MIVANLLRPLILLALFLAAHDAFSWVVYAAVFLETTFSAFFEPAENALLSHLVDEDRLLTANSLNALNNTLARVIGPPLGGALLGLFGLGSVLLFDILSYLIAAVLIAYIIIAPEPQDTSPQAPPGARFWLSWRQGVRHIATSKAVIALFVVIGLMTFGGTMQDPLMAPFVDDILQGDALVLGWLLTAQGLGGVLSGFVIGHWGKKLQPVIMLGASTILAGLLLLVVFNLPSIRLAIALHVVLGLPMIGRVPGYKHSSRRPSPMIIVAVSMGRSACGARCSNSSVSCRRAYWARSSVSCRYSTHRPCSRLLPGY